MKAAAIAQGQLAEERKGSWQWSETATTSLVRAQMSKHSVCFRRIACFLACGTTASGGMDQTAHSPEPPESTCRIPSPAYPSILLPPLSAYLPSPWNPRHVGFVAAAGAEIFGSGSVLTQLSAAPQAVLVVLGLIVASSAVPVVKVRPQLGGMMMMTTRRSRRRRRRRRRCAVFRTQEGGDGCEAAGHRSVSGAGRQECKGMRTALSGAVLGPGGFVGTQRTACAPALVHCRCSAHATLLLLVSPPAELSIVRNLTPQPHDHHHTTTTPTGHPGRLPVCPEGHLLGARGRVHRRQREGGQEEGGGGKRREEEGRGAGGGGGVRGRVEGEQVGAVHSGARETGD